MPREVPPAAARQLLGRQARLVAPQAQEVLMARVEITAGPLPALLDLLAEQEYRELLQDLGAPPEAVRRQVALLRQERARRPRNR